MRANGLATLESDVRTSVTPAQLKRNLFLLDNITLEGSKVLQAKPAP